MMRFHTPGPSHEPRPTLVQRPYSLADEILDPDAPAWEQANERGKALLCELATEIDRVGWKPPTSWLRGPVKGAGTVAQAYVRKATYDELDFNLRHLKGSSFSLTLKGRPAARVQYAGNDYHGTPCTRWAANDNFFSHRAAPVQPTGAGPWLGSGRDPVTNWGLVQVDENRYMWSCCGQREQHPGCWVAHNEDLVGQVIPYDAIKGIRGTAWLDSAWYGKIHDQIVALRDQLGAAAFDEPIPEAVLVEPANAAKVARLFALEHAYNQVHGSAGPRSWSSIEAESEADDEYAQSLVEEEAEWKALLASKNRSKEEKIEALRLEREKTEKEQAARAEAERLQREKADRVRKARRVVRLANEATRLATEATNFANQAAAKTTGIAPGAKENDKVNEALKIWNNASLSVAQAIVNYDAATKELPDVVAFMDIDTEKSEARDAILEAYTAINNAEKNIEEAKLAIEDANRRTNATSVWDYFQATNTTPEAIEAATSDAADHYRAWDADPTINPPFTASDFLNFPSPAYRQSFLERFNAEWIVSMASVLLNTEIESPAADTDEDAIIEFIGILDEEKITDAIESALKLAQDASAEATAVSTSVTDIDAALAKITEIINIVTDNIRPFLNIVNDLGADKARLVPIDRIVATISAQKKQFEAAKLAAEQVAEQRRLEAIRLAIEDTKSTALATMTKASDANQLGTIDQCDTATKAVTAAYNKAVAKIKAQDPTSAAIADLDGEKAAAEANITAQKEKLISKLIVDAKRAALTNLNAVDVSKSSSDADVAKIVSNFEAAISNYSLRVDATDAVKVIDAKKLELMTKIDNDRNVKTGNVLSLDPFKHWIYNSALAFFMDENNSRNGLETLKLYLAEKDDKGKPISTSGGKTNLELTTEQLDFLVNICMFTSDRSVPGWFEKKYSAGTPYTKTYIGIGTAKNQDAAIIQRAWIAFYEYLIARRTSSETTKWKEFSENTDVLSYKANIPAQPVGVSNDREKRLISAESMPVFDPLNPSLIIDGRLENVGNSCWVDSSLTALFIYPNSAVVREIFEATSLYLPVKTVQFAGGTDNTVYGSCNADGIIEIHKQLAADIRYMQEGGSNVEFQCSKVRQIWQDCFADNSTYRKDDAFDASAFIDSVIRLHDLQSILLSGNIYTNDNVAIALPGNIQPMVKMIVCETGWEKDNVFTKPNFEISMKQGNFICTGIIAGNGSHFVSFAYDFLKQQWKYANPLNRREAWLTQLFASATQIVDVKDTYSGYYPSHYIFTRLEEIEAILRDSVDASSAKALAIADVTTNDLAAYRLTIDGIPGMTISEPAPGSRSAPGASSATGSGSPPSSGSTSSTSSALAPKLVIAPQFTPNDESALIWQAYASNSTALPPAIAAIKMPARQLAAVYAVAGSGDRKMLRKARALAAMSMSNTAPTPVVTSPTSVPVPVVNPPIVTTPPAAPPPAVTTLAPKPSSAYFFELPNDYDVIPLYTRAIIAVAQNVPNIRTLQSGKAISKLRLQAAVLAQTLSATDTKKKRKALSFSSLSLLK